MYYYRAIVAVGNGRGLFGIGIAFGSKPKDARSNAALAAIQNMRLIDLDPAGILTTPQHAQEYSAHVKSQRCTYTADALMPVETERGRCKSLALFLSLSLLCLSLSLSL